jgi:predicted secreted Zn-dependent protease
MDRWIEFLEKAGKAEDPYLQELERRNERHEQIKLLSAFMHAIRTKDLNSISTHGLMASKTCRAHVASVAETVVLRGCRDPRFDMDGSISRILSKQAK